MRQVKALLLILALLCLVSTGMSGPAFATPSNLPKQPAPKLRGTVVWPPRMRPAFPFALRDQNGQELTLRSLHNRVSVVTFLDAHCTTACPVTGRELALTQQQLGGSHSPLLLAIIDVDPWKDTVASERAFAHKVGLVGNWHWLSGTRQQLTHTWTIWGEYVKPETKDIIHTAAVYLVDQHGFVRVADEVPLRPDWLADSVRALVKQRHGKT